MPPEIPAPLPQAFNVATHFIDRPAREHPGRVAIVGEPAAVTYAELSLLVNRVGNALRGSKRQPGERVLIVVPDSAEFIASFFGAAKIGDKLDRKSTRLNSSHLGISYAVFCLKKKKRPRGRGRP